MAQEKSDKKKQKRNRIIRFTLLIGVLLFSTALGLLHQYGTLSKPAGVDAFCPFGGLESLITLLISGTMLKRIALSSFILLAGVLITVLFFRRSFCGTICPLGTIQEIFGSLGKLVLKKHLAVPAKADMAARFLKYGILIAVVAGSWITGSLFIRPYDPWPAYHHLLSPDLFAEFFWGFIVLVVTVVMSFFVSRFFCKYICPMGAFLGLISRIGIFRITRNDETCTHCKLCNRVCPVQIPVESMNQVHSSECLTCCLCVEVCPEKKTLYPAGPKGRAVTTPFIIFATLGILIAVIAVTTITGHFEWGQKSLAQEVIKKGSFDPDLIKGRMTFEEIVQSSGIPKDAFLEAFPITEEEFKQPIKDVHEHYDFETEDIREFTRQYLGLDEKK